MAISDFQDLFFFETVFSLAQPTKSVKISQDLHFERPRPGAMKALRQKLQRHQITRQWVGLDSDKQAVPHDEQELLGDCAILNFFWSQSDTLILIGFGLLLQEFDVSSTTCHLSIFQFARVYELPSKVSIFF